MPVDGGATLLPTEVSTATDYTEADEHHRSARDEKLNADSVFAKLKGMRSTEDDDED
jgi:hypothetical protein